VNSTTRPELVGLTRLVTRSRLFWLETVLGSMITDDRRHRLGLGHGCDGRQLVRTNPGALVLERPAGVSTNLIPMPVRSVRKGSVNWEPPESLRLLQMLFSTPLDCEFVISP
jgi:hypothetical protein